MPSTMMIDRVAEDLYVEPNQESAVIGHLILEQRLPAQNA